MVLLTYALQQDQTTRDAVSQQVRDQINAARQEAQAAAKGARTPDPPVPPALPGGGAGTVQQISWNPNNDDIPPRVMGLGIAFLVTLAAVVIFGPLTRAIARRLDRAGSAPKLQADVTGQLSQLSHAVDAIAVEVERISEGQRFTTKLLSEQRGDASRTILAPAANASGTEK